MTSIKDLVEEFYKDYQFNVSSTKISTLKKPKNYDSSYFFEKRTYYRVHLDAISKKRKEENKIIIIQGNEYSIHIERYDL